MLALAEKNKAKAGAGNVEFVDSRITSIPLDDGIADAVISNCVVNLVPEDEKQLVFDEMFRLLKPGGRVAISDILAKEPLPEKLRKCAAAYAGCVAGASLVGQYETYLQHAGFKGR
jgi:ubiquinone/menaquinone biosynthesis C-methylase UbiE